MLGFPNAKINIGLNVVEKRSDGFHNLETIFYPVNIFDSLEILYAQEPNFYSYGLEIPGSGKDNLCMRAFALLKSKFNIPDVEIHLLKNIPFGAGLGGGSADAAWVLKMLSSKFKLGLSISELEKLSAELGSDCAFFIQNSAQFAKGRGEILEKVDLDLQNYCFALIKPYFGISTKEAFSGLVPKPSQYNLKESVRLPISAWREIIKNDFEESIFPKFPELPTIKNELYNKGAIYASMSGSGSTIFGIFPMAEKSKFSSLLNHKVFWA